MSFETFCQAEVSIDRAIGVKTLVEATGSAGCRGGRETIAKASGTPQNWLSTLRTKALARLNQIAAEGDKVLARCEADEATVEAWGAQVGKAEAEICANLNPERAPLFP
ncbi:MAG: hypothetical protein PHR51_02835 [Patescibacteria group bacterium]|nr:hypothetical protein [Patescibacteria group bacterium]